MTVVRHEASVCSGRGDRVLFPGYWTPLHHALHPHMEDGHMEHVSDTELMADAALGSSEAVAELYRRHQQAAVRFAHSMTRSHANAEDIAAEAFVRTLIRIRSGSTLTTFRAYLYAAVRNLYLDQWRRKPELEHILGLHPRITHDITTPDPAPAIVDTLAFEAMLDPLPPTYQHVLRLSIVDGYTNTEIAQHLGKSPSVAASLTYRARVALRQLHSDLDPDGTTPC
jgi:RNA polymerase sigma factor (sigma-70 family)